jgi:hypothetical protein
MESLWTETKQTETAETLWWKSVMDILSEVSEMILRLDIISSLCIPFMHFLSHQTKRPSILIER